LDVVQFAGKGGHFSSVVLDLNVDRKATAVIPVIDAHSVGEPDHAFFRLRIIPFFELERDPKIVGPRKTGQTRGMTDARRFG
jgi:hypothetical protein